MHRHQFITYGDLQYCSCGVSRIDPRAPEQIAHDRELATLQFKVRVNKAMGVESPVMSARIAELSEVERESI